MNEQVSGVGPQDAHVGEAPARHPVGGELIVLVGPLDADEVAIRLGPSPAQQKAALAAADLELDRMIVVEQTAQVGRRAARPATSLLRAPGTGRAGSRA